MPPFRILRGGGIRVPAVFIPRCLQVGVSGRDQLLSEPSPERHVVLGRPVLPLEVQVDGQERGAVMHAGPGPKSTMTIAAACLLFGLWVAGCTSAPSGSAGPDSEPPLPTVSVAARTPSPSAAPTNTVPTATAPPASGPVASAPASSTPPPSKTGVPSVAVPRRATLAVSTNSRALGRFVRGVTDPARHRRRTFTPPWHQRA